MLVTRTCQWMAAVRLVCHKTIIIQLVMKLERTGDCIRSPMRG